MSYRIEAAGLSHPGRDRTNNEDALLLEQAVSGTCAQGIVHWRVSGLDHWQVAVADGMGGANAGEEASLRVVKTLGKSKQSTPASVEDTLRIIHHNLLEASKANAAWTGMGAAVAGLFGNEQGVFAFNVGDCRVYRVVDTFLQQLSVDDSLGGVLAEAGLADGGPRRAGQHALVQVLGGLLAARPVNTHISSVRLKSATRFLICSDGLTDMLPLEQMEALTTVGIPAQATQSLVTAALEAGGQDNVTVVVLDVALADRAEKTTQA